MRVTAARARRRGVFATLREFGERIVALVQLIAVVAGGVLQLLGAGSIRRSERAKSSRTCAS